jgi:hypothetical protein
VQERLAERGPCKAGASHSHRATGQASFNCFVRRSVNADARHSQGAREPTSSTRKARSRQTAKDPDGSRRLAWEETKKEDAVRGACLAIEAD